jgi:hypothetical protein
MTPNAEKVAAVFTEWHRQWIETPDAFATEAEVQAQKSGDYGSAAAATFARIWGELDAT